ncbi:MAG: 23S rRNA (uracil(1939)-C(5))-methyltransferase RlmD, partial [Candidatus Baltobacteraceae bacterium]
MTIKDTPANAAARLAPGAQVELAFNDLLANGQAVGRTGGMVIFCFGPLPQERARVRIQSIKPKYAVAELVQLLVKSPLRATPFCPVFGTCGGCQVQHLAYPGQLQWKQQVVKSALARIGGFPEAEVRDTMGMINPRSYRNKMSLVADRSGEVPRVGFYRQRSHDVVPIDACPIVAAPLSAQIPRINDMLAAPETAAALASTRHIVARAARATEQTVITFTMAEPSAQLKSLAPEMLRRLPGTAGITESFDLTSVNAIMGRRHQLAAGAAQIEEQIAGVRYRVSPGSFFQVNVEIVARIFEFMRPGLETPRTIVDLYCGAGTFSLFFAKCGSTVFGIEESARAIGEAQENAALNGLRGAQFSCGKVEDVLRRAEGRAALENAQIVFLDPPRNGS